MLDDVPDGELDRIAEMGFDWVWFLSVWQTGSAAQQVSRSNAGWRREFEETLPDLTEEDIGGQALPFRTIRFIAISAGLKHLHVCGSACRNAD